MKATSVVEKKLMHYIGKAIADYNMIQTGDKVMLCLSGGKDSYSMVNILNKLRVRSHNKFSLGVFVLDQGQPGWDDSGMRAWLEALKISYEIVRQDTYSIVMDKVPEGKTYCSLCSRLRRGIMYTYAGKQGYSKIALGHHRDDLIQSLLMSIIYNGKVASMPPKLLTDNKEHIVIRPLAYCQEQDIIEYAKERQFPIIPCNLCGNQENLKRKEMKNLIASLAADNKNIPSNILHALTDIKPSQLMDKNLWDFKNLEQDRESAAALAD